MLAEENAPKQGSFHPTTENFKGAFPTSGYIPWVRAEEGKEKLVAY